jgi:iron complex transport system substrate-binding protein
MKDVVGPRVYYEVDPKLFTATDDTFIGEQLRLLRATNIAAKGDRPFPQISQEFIVAADPEVILLSDAPPTGNESRETVSQRPGWAGISAVRTGRIYPIDGNLSTRPGPRVVEAIETLARTLYPERMR